MNTLAPPAAAPVAATAAESRVQLSDEQLRRLEK